MIDRYIYAVTRELPRKHHNEIASELRTLIDDMIEGMDNHFSEEEKIEYVLRDLGNPKELAARYRGRERYLIGPNYYDKYILVMKIVIIAIFIGISIGTGFGVVFNVTNISEIIWNYIGTLFSGILHGTAWVTGIFALLEYNQVSVKNEKEEEWDPSQLPELPNEKAHISRGESIFSIMFITILLTLFFFLPEMIGVYYTSDGQWNVTPLFNIEVLAAFKLIIFIVFTMSILSELIKIIKGRWTVKIAIITSLLNVISAIIFVYVMYNTEIWNNEIKLQIEQYTPLSFESMLLLTAVIIIIIAIAESITALYKGIKYGSTINN